MISRTPTLAEWAHHLVRPDDPSARAALIECVGVDEYNRLHEEHRRQSVILIALIETLATHRIKAALHQMEKGGRCMDVEEFVRLAEINGVDPVRVLRCFTRKYR
jgi:hypothetical protein